MKKGFTLVELLIVIMVIAILIGIALPRFGGMRDEGNTVKAAAELRTLQAAIESYYIHQGHAYPEAGGWQTTLTGVAPQIIGAVLNDPFTSPAAPYSYQKAGSYYIIWSKGPEGTDASITNAGVVTEGGIYISNGDKGSGGF